MYYVIIGSFKPALNMSLLDNMFFGYFNTETSGPIPNGELRDSIGLSAIGELKMNAGSHMEFSQFGPEARYIKYTLHRVSIINNSWEGSAEENGKESHVKCILTPVEVNFIA